MQPIIMWRTRMPAAENPTTISVNIEPVFKGRVQILTRVTSTDKNDIMRAVNALDMHQSDVIRMFLMQGIRAFLAERRANRGKKKGGSSVPQLTIAEAAEALEIATDNFRDAIARGATQVSTQHADEEDSPEPASSPAPMVVVERMPLEEVETIYSPDVAPGTHKDD